MRIPYVSPIRSPEIWSFDHGSCRAVDEPGCTTRAAVKLGVPEHVPKRIRSHIQNTPTSDAEDLEGLKASLGRFLFIAINQHPPTAL